MSRSARRDRFQLRRSDLLEDHAKVAQQRPGAALATALRENSPQMIQILAFQATKGNNDWDSLREVISSGNFAAIDRSIPAHILDIAIFLMLRPQLENDRDIARIILERVLDRIPPKKGNFRARRTLVEHLILSRERQKALDRLQAWEDLDTFGDGYLRAELDNPHMFAEGNRRNWLSNLNRQFADNGHWPIDVTNEKGLSAFDRIVCTPPAENTGESSAGDDPLVTVVIPTYQPNKDELTTAVKSICAQTITNIEIIIVDDASGSEYTDTINSVVQLDPRVRAIFSNKNAGAYVARNIGYMEARGTFVTGQDDDDWSHPDRLAVQVKHLQTHPSTVACRIGAVTCLPNLCRVRYGYKFQSPNASSLMIRTDAFRNSGGFLPIRKAADTELHLRLEQVTGMNVDDIDEVLSLVRITPESLSRSEFRAGWSHPARGSFKSSYNLWHSTSSPEDLKLRPGSKPAIAVPSRFKIDSTSKPPRYDVVFAGNWRRWGGPQKSMLEEIHALLAKDLKLAVMDLDAARFMSTKQPVLCDQIQKLINSGSVDQLLYDDFAETDLLILRYPPILQFMPREASNLSAEKMMILANQAPSEVDGTDVRYLVPDCDANAKSHFAENVVWAPQGPQVRKAITPYLTSEQLTSFDIPGILNVDEWIDESPRPPRSMLPVVGRYSRDDAMKWPASAATIEKIYPTASNVDVRIMGGIKKALAIIGTQVVPPGWTSYDFGAMPPKEFLRTIDFFVFFQHPNATEAFGRSILEAIASGVVVILPPHFEETFGRSAIYSKPSHVLQLVKQLHADRDAYEQQRTLARQIVKERFSYVSYSRLISHFLQNQPEAQQ